MRLKLIILSTLMCSTPVLSTTFIPITLEKQIENASGVLKAKFQSIEYRKISENKIITEATFKIIKSVGIKQSEIVNKNNFKVIYPGGKWQNLDYRVSGAPSFKKDEETLLILKKTSHGYTVKGLGVGKYDVIKNESGEYYKSSIFPSHMSLGKVSESTLKEILMDEFGATLEKVKSDKFVNIPQNNVKKSISTRGRLPASVGRGPNSQNFNHNDEDSSRNPIWIVILFSLLGMMSGYRVRKSKRIK